MENDTCEGFSHSALVVFSSTNYAAIFVCIVAVILVFALKLFRKPVYRLALYQDLAALFYATQCGLQLILLRYDTPSTTNTYRPSCVLFGWWHMYSLWVKLLMSVCVAFHLFYLAVCNKNLKKFELVYVGVSLLVPAAISIVPFTTKSYGLAGSWCWVENTVGGCSNETSLVGLVEQFALWFGPSMTLAFLSSSAMVGMVGVMMYRVCTHRRHTYEPGTREDQNWNALKQVLPLAAYPIVTFIFFVPSFINRIHGATSHTVSQPLSVLSASGAAGWSIAPGVTLIVHISIASLCAKKYSQKDVNDHYHRYSSSEEGGGAMTAGKEMITDSTSITRFPLPDVTVDNDNYGAV